jgi:hypothetical protein
MKSWQMQIATAVILMGVVWAIAWGPMAPEEGSASPEPVQARVDSKSVKLVPTGTAFRKKLFVKVYKIDSYIQEGVKVRTAEELAAVDCVKRLQLTMERTVDGAEMAGAFEEAIRRNHPAPAFEAEIKQLTQSMRGHSADKGDPVYLTHTPGEGLHCHLPGKIDVVIKNPRFSRAVWDVYLGKNNLGEDIKKGLVSQLGQTSP